MKAVSRVNVKLASATSSNAGQKIQRQSAKCLSTLNKSNLVSNPSCGNAKPSISSRRNLSAFTVTDTTLEESRYSEPTNTNTLQEKEKKEELLSYEAAKELTKVLQEPAFHKLGAFSETTWKSVDHLIRSWACLRTEESVDATFTLLERLVVEQELLLQNRNSVTPGEAVVNTLFDAEEREKMQQLSREILNTELLNMVIKNWRECWKANHTKISPRAILPQLEGFMDRSPSLHPDTKTYNMVMDASTKRFGKKAAEKLAEEIFQRMTNQTVLPSPSEKKPSYDFTLAPALNGKLRCINDISPDEYTHSTLLNVYAYSGNPKAAEAALCRFINDFQNGRIQTQPTIHAFTGCIKAWSRSGSPTAPEKAERILQLMTNLEKQPPMKNIQPSVITYNAVLDCWAKSRREDAADAAEALLAQMEATQGIYPDIISYRTVISILTRSHQHFERAENILRRMYNIHKRGGPRPKPDRDCYVMLLQALSAHADKIEYAPRKAERYLQRMMDAGHQPDLKAYNSVLRCWAMFDSEEAGRRARKILDTMKTPLSHRTLSVEPNTLSFNSAITAFARNGQAKEAEQLFWAMYRERSGGNQQVKPQLRTFNTVLSAWANARGVSDADRVRAMVDLFDRIPKSGALAIKPDAVSCNTLLNVLAQHKSEAGCEYAEKVLAELRREYAETKDVAMRPDKFSYTAVMRAHANIGNLKATRDVFDRMLEDYKNGNESARPDIVPFNNLLIAIARGARGRNLGAGKLADDVFKQMQEYYDAGILMELPNKKSYDIKINCWAMSGSKHAGDEAEKIIQEMEEKSANGFPELKPDTVSFSTVMNAHAKCGNYVAAEALFKRMLDEYSRGNENMKPNLQTVNTVLSALANSNVPGAPEKAEAYLRELLMYQESPLLSDLKPDAVTFSCVITAWANSGDPRAGERAKVLFRQLEHLSKKPDSKIRLDAGFYKCLLRAYAVSGDIATAEALLETIKKGELTNIQVDRFMYSAVLNAYATSSDPSAAEKAEAMLKEMEELAITKRNHHIQPNAECYMHVLECWGNSDQHQKAAERSEALLIEMKKKMKPAPAIFTRVLNTMSQAGDTKRMKALMKRMSDERVEMEALAPFTSMM